MANLILRLKRNVETGEQELLIDYESDGDRLPFEHEEDHRKWLKKVFDDSELEQGDDSPVQIDRKSVTSQQDRNEQTETEDSAISQRNRLKA